MATYSHYFLKPLIMKLDTNIDGAIAALKAKMREASEGKNQIDLTQILGIQKNFFGDLKKKKTFTINELVAFSEYFDFDFFSLIELKLKTQLPPVKRERKAKITVTLEVENESQERIILETILDKQAVKKLLG